MFGIADKQRNEFLKDTPTFAEQGYPEVMDVSVAGIWAPAGTPKPVLDTLKKALADAMKMPETKAGLDKAGQTLFAGTPEQFQASIEKDGEMYNADFKKLGIQPE